jgi:glycerol-3-phosphate dehydrogenase
MAGIPDLFLSETDPHSRNTKFHEADDMFRKNAKEGYVHQ